MKIRTLAWSVLLSLAATAGISAQESEYKPFHRSLVKTLYFEVRFDEGSFAVLLPNGDSFEEYTVANSDLVVERDQVVAPGVFRLDGVGLHAGDQTLSFDLITDASVMSSKRWTTVKFYTRENSGDKSARFRRGNVIEPFSEVIIPDEEFIRGMVFTVTGDIEVYGEVGEDVISLFGDVFVGPRALVRGDVVTTTGRADFADDATIYGEVYSGKTGRTGRGSRFRTARSQVSFGVGAYYNRVDGLEIGCRLGYDDRDSILPTVWAEAGYAFESERWRYDLGLEQTILRKPALTVGGSAYRKLASEDDWLITPAENTVMALVACEDFMDYYEAEGAKAYIKFRPIEDLTFEVGYRWEETGWLEAQPNLWSLFGRDKDFRGNFSSVDLPYRLDAAAAIDTSTDAAIYTVLDWDTRDTAAPFDHSAWAVTSTAEWSHPDLRSDLDYSRFTLNVRRYQKVHRRAMIILRGMFGESDGCPPMYKRFYLGGLGSLRGYKHKEFMGTRFWMANAEYRVSFPRTDLAASLFWDIGQIANEAPLDENAEIRNSLGVSVYIGDDFKVSLAKRLDRSENNDPKFYVRLAHVL